MTKRTKKEQTRRAEWWARRPWPCAVLGIDPGGSGAGAALAIPDGLVWARSIDTDTSELEQAVEDAATAAIESELRLVVVLEDWSPGGPLGIQGWLGLGAARGHWKRAVVLRSLEGHQALPSRMGIFAHALVQTWRSMMEVPARGPCGEKHDKQNDGWKRAAARRLAELAPDAKVDSSDAVEAALIALYGQRCDAVGELLPRTYLRAHGFSV